jgi:hypothetical protein
MLKVVAINLGFSAGNCVPTYRVAITSNRNLVFQTTVRMSSFPALESRFMNPLKTEAIQRFLQSKTHEDLARLYNPAMEVQVNVGRDGGKRIDAGELKGREYNAWTDGINQWKPFRIPMAANTEPVYEDKPISFSLEHHAEGIGMTGWDWKDRVSRWVAFDFDAIIGHSDKHSKKLTEDELRKVQDVVSRLPFVTLRKSTSGKGLHLYIMLNPVPTANHTEHAALARAVLSMLSGLTAFDFGSKVDVCGGNMWVWHRKMYDKDGKQNDGLKLIKAGETLDQVPANWRDHLNVVSKRASKAMPSFVHELDVNDPDKLFAELTGQRTRIPLECDHQAVIDYLANNGCVWWWDADHWMLVTHTIHLKEAHGVLKLRGKFDTNATGADRGFDHNCFCFPLRGGAWAVRRYSLGTQEHESWEQDGNGYTRCFLNREPDLHTLARLNDGVELEKGGYHFRHAESIVKVLTALGIAMDLPNFIMSRSGVIKPLYKENKLVVHIDAEGSDDGSKMKGWLNEKKLWKRVFKTSIPHTQGEETKTDYDDILRHIITSSDQDAGWVVKRENKWTEEPLVHVKHVLSAMGHEPKEINQIVGSGVMKGWTLVNKPFQPEYPGNREWNRGAAQLAVVPSTEDIENLRYPHWTRIMRHCGSGLDGAIQSNDWCKSVGINSGAEFLMLWVSSLLRRPNMPMTYLAFHGPQDSGKSIFHEAISQILVTRGVMRADNALQSSSNFNGELANAVLCVVEETDLKHDKTAYNRIKDWVTSPEIMIRPLFSQGYMMPNCTHWIQCANELEACPVFPGDTRITLSYVPALSEEEKIPKEQLMTLLKKEAPDFLAALMATELPKSNDRLAVPTIATESKKRAEDKNRSMLEQFIDEEVVAIDGHCVESAAFYEAFMGWLEDADRSRWSKQRVGRELPDKFPRGRLSGNQHVHYGNMLLKKDYTDQQPATKYKNVNLFITQKT